MFLRRIALFAVALGCFMIHQYLTHPSVDTPEKFLLSNKVAPPIPDYKNENLLVFMQISDTHINHFAKHSDRIDRFKKFCSEVIPMVSPQFVVLTGDIVDAKNPDHTSIQSEIEWQTYQTILKENNLFRPEFWVDLRGNHDCFDVGTNWNSEKNFFQFYSVTGSNYKKPVRTFSTFLNKYSSYGILSIDACPKTGARSPFNFFGRLHQKQVDQVEMGLKDLAARNHTVVIGHYPLSTIGFDQSSSGKNIIEVLQAANVSLYLCGHLHSFFGLAPTMYARHSSSLFELELVDFKESQKFRIIAIDHDLVSFVDVKLGELPIVMITNPKSAEFLSSNEPLERMALSSHIRILAYSTVGIDSIQVKIDSEIISERQTIKKTPGLFTVAWDPSKYSKGIHQIEVTVQDVSQRVGIAKQTFSLDGTRADHFGILPTMLLLSDISYIMKALYILIDISMIWIFFSILRLSSEPARKKSQNSSTIRKPLLYTLTFGLVFSVFRWIFGSWREKSLGLRSRHLLFVFLSSTWMMMLIMPWFIAELSSSGNYGCVFFWGILHFFPDAPSHYVAEFFYTMDTNLFGLVQLQHYISVTGFFWFFSEDPNLPVKPSNEESASFRRKRALFVLFMYIGTIYVAFSCYKTCKFVMLCYGWVALIFSPYVGWYNFVVILFLLQSFYYSVRKSLSKPILIQKDSESKKSKEEDKVKTKK